MRWNPLHLFPGQRCGINGIIAHRRSRPQLVWLSSFDSSRTWGARPDRGGHRHQFRQDRASQWNAVRRVTAFHLAQVQGL